MTRDFLNSPTDGHKVTAASVASAIAAGALLDTGSVLVAGSGTRTSGRTGTGSTSGCGWNDPYVAYPAYPCAHAAFPTVSITGVPVSDDVTDWYLTLTFSSCNPYCNIWNISYSQNGPSTLNSGGDTIICTAPGVHNIRIYPSYVHSPHFTYDYTIYNCCDSSQSGSVSLS